MYKNWKRMAALALTVLLGCMIPMGTILAASDAETNAETGAVSLSDNDVPELSAPEIVITRGGDNKTCSLGGAVSLEYTNNGNALFEVSVTPNGREVTLFYALDKVTDVEAEAKNAGQMDSLAWGEITSPPMSIESLQGDGCYVVYVKAEAGTQKFYARSNGIVVDTQKPVIKEAGSGQPLVSGKTYPKDTGFVVEEANLKSVLVNQQPAVCEGGSYKAVAKENSTSCEIKVIDLAGNEETCAITLSDSGAPEPEQPEPESPDDGNVISKEGKYALKAGVKYRLAGGNWKVDGDKSVYRGGNDFYVTVDGTYQFKK